MKNTFFLLCALIFVVHADAQTIVTQPAPPRVFTYVERMPETPYDQNKYIADHIVYPDSAKKAGVTGRVITRFVVNEDGKLSNIQVLRGLGYGCDEEAVRVISAMPPWKPGKQNGKPVAVYMTLPLTFRLQ